MTGISVITCTMRPDKIMNALENFNNQLFENKELILILNRDDFSLRRVKQLARKTSDVRIFKKPQNDTLGACLNFGISHAKYSVIAKFDDDDYYSPNYLTQAYRALKTTEASIVGKDAHTTYFEESKTLGIIRSHKQNEYTHHVGGGTLVFEKAITSAVKFPNKTVGEDIEFQQSCLQLGYKIYSTDGNNYVSIRRQNKKSHTWGEEDEELLKECDIIAKTDDYKPYVEEDI